MGGEMRFTMALQGLKLTDDQMPVAIAALEAERNSHSLDSLKDITINMFATHRQRLGTSEAFHAVADPAPSGDPTSVEE